MAQLVELFPCAPSTERGRGIQLSGDPETSSIAYCSRRSVIIQRLDNTVNAIVYRGHSAETTVARFSPNGEWIASADIYGFVRIWDRVGYDNPLFRANDKVFSSRIDDLQWSPDGESLVVCGCCLSGELFVRAFDWKTRRYIGHFQGHHGRVLSCFFQPKPPHRLVTCGTDFLVNCYHWPQLTYITNHGHTGPVNCVSYSPDGDKFISVSSDHKAFIYNGRNGVRTGELPTEGGHTGSIFSVSWCSDSKHVLTVSADNSAKIWEIADCSDCAILKKTLICPGLYPTHDDMLVGCLWLKDSIVIVSLSGMISVFSAADLDKAPVFFSGHREDVNALSCYIERGMKVILSSDDDGKIIRWTQGLGYVGHIKRKDYTPTSCLTAVQGIMLVSGKDNMVKRIHLNDDSACRDIDAHSLPILNGDHDCRDEVIDANSCPVDLSIALQFPDLSLISTEFEVMILKGAKVLSTTHLDYSATASAIAPNGREVIVGDKNGKLHMYSVQGDHTLSGEILLERHLGPISLVKYSPDGKFFASADIVHETVVWDCASRKEKLKNLFYHMNKITCLACSPDSRKVATGSLDSRVIVYELEKHRSSRVTIEDVNYSWVSALAFIDNDTLVNSGRDGSLRFWRITNQ